MTTETPLTDGALTMEPTDGPVNATVVMQRVITLARRLEMDRARLVSLVRYYKYDGHLQTFEDRQRFRKAANELLAELERNEK
jgi:hypothetical protein